ncbi:MAG: YceI family protein [Gammaproteobacteria bacterium]|nr:YceI family protein [Gammaproteobacteria bacterium]
MLIKIRRLQLLLLAMSATAVHANDINSGHITGPYSNTGKLGLAYAQHIYEIQQNTSSLAFRVDGPFGDVWGSFQNFRGDFAMLNSGAEKKMAAIEIDAESLNTSASFIRAMLKSESFFDVEKFPSIRFNGKSIEWYSDTQAVLKGEMTIQKKTLPVAFYVELVDAYGEKSDRIMVKASTTIKRSQFGLYTLLPIVSDNVNIFMNVDALRKDTDISMVSAVARPQKSIN